MGMVQFKPRNTDRARKLRNQASPAERILWKHLSKRQIHGYKFSRQLPIDPYFCDFLCREKKLVVEIDGESHNQSQEYDAERTALLRDEGYHVIRFTNSDVLDSVEGVGFRIVETIRNMPTPIPSRSLEGDI